MPIDTANIRQGYRRKVLLAKQFDFIPSTIGIVGADADLASKAAFDAGFVATTANFASGDATTQLQEISTFAINGVLMNTNGDVVHTSWDIPDDCDYGKPVYFRVRWTTGSQTSADTVLWKVFYKLISLDNDALTATVDTALNTAIATDTVGSTTAYVLRKTSWGKMNANSVNNIDNTLLLQVEMDTKAVGLSEDLYFHSLEIAYQPLVKTAGRGRVLVAPT